MFDLKWLGFILLFESLNISLWDFGRGCNIIEYVSLIF